MTALHRRPGAASAFTLAGFLVAAGAAQLVAPEWARACGLDVWNAAAARADLDTTLDRGERLDGDGARLVEQMRAADGVAARLAAGRISLAAAAAELDALNADRPSWADGLRYSQPDAPDHRARVARYAIGKVERLYAADPAAWAAVAPRLEAEYRALVG